MRKSMRTRLIVIFCSMLLATIVCFCLINFFLLPSFYQNSKVSQMKKVYSEVTSTCSNVDWANTSEENLDEIYDTLDTLSENTNVNIYILQIGVSSITGNISNLEYVYPTNDERLREVMRSNLDKYVSASYLGKSLDKNIEVLNKSENFEIYKAYDDRIESNYIELTGQLPQNYWIYLRSNYQSIQESNTVSTRLMIYIGMVILVLGVIIMYFIGKHFTQPLLELTQHAENMKELNFSSKYETKREDEVGILANSMNTLSDKLEETISELKTANNELQTDLARKTELEDMRTEFLANVSHELKTPIALIQGYAEGLLDNINDDEESRNFYCDVIIDEANKMNNMVKKLLNLNQLEFGKDQIHMSHFDLQKVIDSVVNASDIVFKQKGVELSYIKEEKPVMVWADEYMIEEVVTNYVSNACNHVKGENKIEIKVLHNDNVARLSVFNTGDPIPQEDIDKIWTKFYKVDKARTREYGGNGIGLSIVKAIMEGHNQNYGVKNYDNGVEFWFELDGKNSEGNLENNEG